MADVNSTARLTVEVVGEDKIRRLLAQLKALGGASGAKKLGLGAGGMAAQIAATKGAVKSSLAPVVAAQAVTGRLVGQMQAAQVTTAKIVKPLAQQQATLAKTVAPLVAGQVAMAKVAKALPAAASAKPSAADIAQGMAIAQAAVARVKARKKEVYPEQKPPPTGVTPKLLSRMAAHGTVRDRVDEAMARYRTPPAAGVPFNKKELAQRGGTPAATKKKAAGLAEEAVEGAVEGAGLGLAGRLGVRAIGGVAAGLGVLATAATGAVTTFLSVKHTFDAANKTADKFVDNMSDAKRAGLTVDELQQRRSVGTAVFGKGYEGLEDRFGKMFGPNKQKKGLFGEKQIFQRLGLDTKSLEKMAKAGEKFSPLAVAEKLAEKRENLEAKLASAKSPKAKAAAQALLDRFWKDVSLLGPGYERAAGFDKASIERMRADQAKVAAAFPPAASEAQQKANAERNLAARTQTSAIASQVESNIGIRAMPAVTQALEAFNAQLLKLAPGASTLAGELGRLTFQGLAQAISGVNVDGLKTKLEGLGKSLEGMTFDQATAALKANIGEAVRSALDNAFKEGAADLSMDSDFVKSAQENWKRMMKAMFGDKSAWDAMFGDPDKQKTMADERREAEERDAEERRRTNAENAKDAEQTSRTVKQNFDDAFAPFVRMTPAPISTQPPGNVRVDTSGRPIGGGAPPPGQQPGGAPGAQVMPSPDLQTAAQTAGNAFNQAVEGGMSSAGNTGGQAFSTAATSGLSTAGTAAGGAFNSAVNASSIGAAIGAAAAAKISAATVTVNVPGAGGGGGGKPSTGTDSPTGGD